MSVQCKLIFSVRKVNGEPVSCISAHHSLYTVTHRSAIDVQYNTEQESKKKEHKLLIRVRLETRAAANHRRVHISTSAKCGGSEAEADLQDEEWKWSEKRDSKKKERSYSSG